MKMNGAQLTWRKIVRGIFSSAVVVNDRRDFPLSEIDIVAAPLHHRVFPLSANL
jgi:hypothetical protein